MNDTKNLTTVPPASATNAAVDWKRWQKCLSMVDWFLNLEARDWLQRKNSLIRSLPSGTVIAIKIADDVVPDEIYDLTLHFLNAPRDWEYVTAPNGLAAMDEFEGRFGKNAVAWVYEIGVPISLGGGLWALSSGV